MSPRTLRSSGGDAGLARPGAAEAGLCARRGSPPLKARECRDFSRFPTASCKPRPHSSRQPSAPSRTPARQSLTATAGSGRPPAGGCPRQCSASRGPAWRLLQPRRDSWVSKGLSRQPGAGCPPRAACPSAHAPARYLRSPSRSSSTWLLSPGGRPSARPLGSAPCTLRATPSRPGKEGRGRLTYISIPVLVT